VINEKKAQEKEEGYTGDKVCEICGKLLAKGEVTPATNNPEMGDSSNQAFWSLMFLLSLGGCVILKAVDKKFKQN